MHKSKMLLVCMGLLMTSWHVAAETLQVSSLRHWTQPTEARVVLDTSNNPDHNVVLLHNPPRLVIDLKNASLQKNFKQPSGANRFFSAFKTIQRGESDLSVIIELKRNISYKSFTLAPNNTYGHRLVIDVFDTGTPSTIIARRTQVDTYADAAKATLSAPTHTEPARVKVLSGSDEMSNTKSVRSSNQALNNEVEETEPKKVESLNRDNHQLLAANHQNSGSRKLARNIVVAIDAGHGGKDPGSHGPEGTLEKEVVFDIAKKLARLIAQQPGMTPVMVRNGDHFIKLRQRMEIARAAKADLFVSIHADAFNNASARGSSVFTLSNRGASSEAARWLANNENAADLVGGVSLDDKDDMLASVLLDLSQTATTEASGHVAKKILSNFKQINPLHKASVQKAGFMVLKSPDIPSILVETAFISNPEEEAKLRSDSHQNKVARAIFNGIVAYFKQYTPLPSPTRVADAAHIDNG